MYSAVRNFSNDIIINANVWLNDGDYGDVDLGTSEASHIYSQVSPARFTKRIIVEPWESVHTKNNYTPYYAKRDDFRQIVKEMVINVGRGYVDNNDQMPLMSRGPNWDSPQDIAERYPKSVQEFIDVREGTAGWFAAEGKPERHESITGTVPYFLSGWGYQNDGNGNIDQFAASNGPDWGYATARDNNIYLHFIKGPDGKNGTSAYFGFSNTFIFKPVETRYLRLYFPEGSSTGASVDLLEVKVKLNNESVNNLALYATVTASSNYDSNRYHCRNVADGIKTVHGQGEWASQGEANPWVKLDWASSITINRIVLYDRPNGSDHSPSGTLTFSDGSTIEVTGIPNNGSAKVIEFVPKTIQWVNFQVTGGAPGNNGLSEFEVIAFNPADVVPITEVALYRMGEDDPGAADGLLGNDPTYAGVGTINLSRSGNPQYNVNAQSSLAMELDGSGDYYTGSGIITETDNVGVELWLNVSPNAAGNQLSVFNTGDAFFEILAYTDGSFYLHNPGNWVYGPYGSWTAGTCHHVALVRENGRTTFCLLLAMFCDTHLIRKNLRNC